MFGQKVIDRFGNKCCGDDFMAGTICTDRPGHAGGHSAMCQNCGGDWYNETCTCPFCECCERNVKTPWLKRYVDTDEEFRICEDCHIRCNVIEGCTVTEPWPNTMEVKTPKRPPGPSNQEVDAAIQSITQSIRTLTTDPPPPAFSSPPDEPDSSRKGQA